MKLFERVIEKRLRKHLEDNGFFSKCQSGFRKSKSTNDHLFRLSQTIMKSFKSCNSGFPRCRESFRQCLAQWTQVQNSPAWSAHQALWLSDFLVGRVIQVKIEGFLSPEVYPKVVLPQGFNLSPWHFLIYVNEMPNTNHHRTNKSQSADDAGQWDVSKSIDSAAEYLQKGLDRLERWCARWRIKLNPEKTKVIIFTWSQTAIRAEPALSLYGDLLSYYLT